MSIYKYKTPNGLTRWRYTFVPRGGDTRKSKSFETKAAAEAWRKKYDPEGSERFITSLDETRLVEYIEKFRKSSKVRGWQDSTIRRYESQLSHIEGAMGHMQVTKITSSDVQSFVTSLADLGLGAKTIREIHSRLGAILAMAKADGLLETIPCSETILPKKQKRRRIFLTYSQVNALFSQVPEDKKALILLLSVAGLRWGEATALRPMDVDLRAGIVHISRTVARGKDGIYFSASAKTSAGARDVAIHSDVATELEKIMQDKGRSDLIFCSSTGAPLHSPNRRSWFSAAVDACHDEDTSFPIELRIHDLRHTAASLMISAGLSVLQVSSQLGHASAAMTLDIYADLFEADRAKISEKMEAYTFKEDD